jgi:hypothetical protein
MFFGVEGETFFNYIYRFVHQLVQSFQNHPGMCPLFGCQVVLWGMDIFHHGPHCCPKDVPGLRVEVAKLIGVPVNGVGHGPFASLTRVFLWSLLGDHGALIVPVFASVNDAAMPGVNVF